MKTDNNPSVIFALYSTPDNYEDFIKAVKKQGLGIREFHLVDIEIPMDKYDDTINFFKHFTRPDFWSDRNPLLQDSMIMNMIKKNISEKTGYKPITFNKNSWIANNRHKLLLSLPCPLFYQDTSMYATTQEEKDNFKKLATFSSNGYVPKITGLYDDDGKAIKGGAK